MSFYNFHLLGKLLLLKPKIQKTIDRESPFKKLNQHNYAVYCYVVYLNVLLRAGYIERCQAITVFFF